MNVNVHIAFQAEDEKQAEEILKGWKLHDEAAVTVAYTPAPLAADVKAGKIQDLQEMPINPEAVIQEAPPQAGQHDTGSE